MGCLGNKERLKTPEEPEKLDERPRVMRTLTRSSQSSRYMLLRRYTSDSLRIHISQFVQKLSEPITNKYRLIKKLGSGNFGEVSLAEHKATGQLRAIKEIRKPKGQSLSTTKFISEVQILSQMDHPNIMKIYELFETPAKYFIVSEVLSGGELFDYIIQSRQLTEPLAAKIMFQLYSAVGYCHERQIVHRDLKPENLLLEAPPAKGDIVIKVIDFGTSCLFSGSERLSQKLGTAYYIAPEVLRMNYTEKCDIWSCGVILYILLSGSPPFAGNTDEEIMRKVKIGKFDFPRSQWRGISEDAKNFIKSQLVMDYTARPTAQQCLNHPWVQQYRTRPSLAAEVIKTSLSNLQSFRAEQRLRVAMMAYIAAQVVSREQTKTLTESFKVLDADGNGRLSKMELIEGYKKTMPEMEAEELVQKVMESCDADGSGFIDYSEFIVASMNLQTLLSKQNLQAAFQAFDRDGSGKISMAELKEMLGGVGDGRDSMWKQLISEADLDGDGEIDIAEFSRLMLQATPI